MKVYTRKGDDGTTGLLGGTRLPKHHLRIETYGTVDELNAFIGVLNDHLKTLPEKDFLVEVQSQLFTIGSHLAADPEKNKFKLPELRGEWIDRFEVEMDKMNESLPEMRNFVLPGGHPAVSACHVCRCVCRRAERACVALAQGSSVDPLILKYLNRLSDYFFVLARKLCSDFDVEEIAWKPE
ncbi:MAG: cob(I)yrinic acid a,c-diamide adenosyltransferase [Salibacteraceae bacterium]